MMAPFTVSSPEQDVIVAYAKWKEIEQTPVRTLMNDGWTLPALSFAHLYEASAACTDLAMISGSVRPFAAHGVFITEYPASAESP